MTMTQNKDLKRIVRARMKKTGESYTAARSQVTKKSPSEKKPSPAVREYATLAGMSDATIRERTGCTWERWVKALDHHGAEKMSHREIAAMVNKTWKVDGWWAQSVTVGYERIKGLRARGQRRDGTYEATKSRTFNVPVETLFEAWANASIRKRWMNGAKAKVRTATAPKSMRIGLEDGAIVAVGFYPKGKGKSSVAVEHAKLPDREAARQMKEYWSNLLEALKTELTS
jgi:uncharacterized protein YndB with AHSA1/START domain